MPRRRVLAGAVAVLGGVAVGLIGSFVHGITAYGVPVGLLAGLLLTLAVCATAGLATGSRGPAACAAFGWVSIVFLLTTRRPEGDLVVPGTLLGYVWLLGGTLVAGAAVSWPYASTGPSPPDR
jgi:Family of unknown function (DUF6113)